VWGPIGAPGRSSIALNLGAELALLRNDVLCADLDTYGASLGQLAGLFDEGSGVAAACRRANSGQLDAVGLRAMGAPMRPGLGLLTGLSDPQRWPELRPAGVEAVLRMAKSSYELVVVDVGFCLEQDEDLIYDTVAPQRNGAAVAAVAAADVVLAVGSADPVGIARLVRAIPDLPSDEPPLVVVNRVRRGVAGRGDPARHIARALGRYAAVTDAVLVPEDVATADAALAAGRTWAEVDSSSPARLAMRELARRLAGPSPAKRSFVRRLLKVGA
jgi:MinD-like ATPase involved in chromosome partitioning or flagellar assembly